MKILITGSDGYIGSVLREYLMARDYQVVGLDTGFYRGVELYHTSCWSIPPCFNTDVRNFQDFMLDGIDAVVYLSELSNDPLGQLNPEITVKNNHEGCKNFALQCIKKGIHRFVYSSSCSIYGASSQGTEAPVVDERSPDNPVSEYAKCKVLNEASLLNIAAENHDFCPVILRNSTVYGPSPSMRFDLCVNAMCGDAWTHNKVLVENEGLAWRPLVHIKDVCQAIHWALEEKQETIHKLNHVFNVGSTEENYQIRDLATMIKVVKPDVTLVNQGYLVDKRSYKVSFEKISSCGYNTKHTVLESIKELFNIFSMVDLSGELFEHRMFRRVKQIQYLLRTSQINNDLFWNSKESII